MVSKQIHRRQPVRWSRSAVLALAVSAWLAGSSAVLAVQTADDDYAYARGLYKSQRYDQAATAFDKFLKENPDHPRAAVATLYHGLTLTNLSQYAEARDRFDSFVKKYPSNANLPDAEYRTAECSYYLKDYADAEQKLSAFRLKHPDHPLMNWAWLFEAESQLSQKKWARAQVSFRTLLDRKPEPQTVRDAQYGLARSLEGQSKVSEAFTYYRGLVRANDPVVTPRALSRMGTMYFKAGDLKSAVRAYSMIDDRYKASPLSVPARLNTGLAYYRMQDYENAIKWLERAGKDKANRPRASILHAISLQKRQQFTAADQLLRDAYTEFSDSKSAPEILYYRADGMRLSGDAGGAVPVFEQIATDWPASPFADDALFFAADSAVQNKDFATADTLLDRLQRDFPTHPYTDNAHMLRGRVLASGATQSDLAEAVTAFKAAGSTARNPRTKLLSQYYVARTQQRLRKHQEALTSAADVVRQVVEGNNSDLSGILVLAAVSHLAMDQLDQAATRATQYIDSFPAGSRRADAFEARAIVRARQSDRTGAEGDLQAMAAMKLDPTRLGNATRRVAEVAWEQKNFTWSAELFEKLSGDRSSPLRPAGLSGLGWSRFEQDKFADAARAFAELIRDHPEAKMIPEATFMLGESHRRAGNPAEAMTAYERAFEDYLPVVAAEKGDEFRTPARFSFEAGRNFARLLERAGRADDADRVYQRLTIAFPDAEKNDQILERWAFMHLDAENFGRSDELFRRLVNEHPQSPLVPNARLALAESDMIANKIPEAEQVFVELKSDPTASDSVRASALYNLISINDRREVDENVRKYAQEYLAAFPDGEFRDHVRLFDAETLIRAGDVTAAQQVLKDVRTSILDPDAAAQPWHGRVWVVIAETQLREKRYDEARQTAAEMLARPAWADYYYQIYEVLGRTYLQEAPPNFDKAREYFRKVIADKVGARTPTAAKCHLYIGDSWVHQRQHQQALQAYQRVYLTFEGLPDLQAAGLFQAASCEEALDKRQDALKSYRELVTKFPTSTHIAEAKKRIQRLDAGGTTP